MKFFRGTFFVFVIILGVLYLGACSFSPSVKTTEVVTELGSAYCFNAEQFFTLTNEEQQYDISYDMTEVNTSELGDYPLYVTYKKLSYIFTVHVEDSVSPIVSFDEDVFFTSDNEFDVMEHVFVSDLQPTTENIQLIQKLHCDDISYKTWTSDDLFKTLQKKFYFEDAENDFVLDEDGIYLARVTSTDFSGNKGKGYAVIVYDTTPPIPSGDVNSIVLVDDEVTGGATINFKDYAMVDEIIGEIPSTKWESSAHRSKNNWYDYRIDITCSDLCGNTDTRCLYFKAAKDGSYVYIEENKDQNVEKEENEDQNVEKKETADATPQTSTPQETNAPEVETSEVQAPSKDEQPPAQVVDPIANYNGTFNEAYAEQMLVLLNNERANAGLPPLTMNYKGIHAAKVRAVESIYTFSHTRPNGKYCASALEEDGIVNYAWVGENLASGQSTPEYAMQCLMESPTHRANILDSDFSEVSIACFYSETEGEYVWYWAQEFLGY